MKKEVIPAPRDPPMPAQVPQVQAQPPPNRAPQAQVQLPPTGAPQAQVQLPPTLAPQAQVQLPPTRAPQAQVQLPPTRAPQAQVQLPPTLAPQTQQRPPAETTHMEPTSFSTTAMNEKTMGETGWRSEWKSEFFRVRDKMTFTMISATITLFLILLILGLVLYVAQEQADVSTTDPDFMLTRTEVTKGQTSTKDATTKQASRPAPSTKKRTPPPTKKAPETIPTEAPKALGIETLLCIYGERTTSDAVMARDGLCHYAFYDSLYARARNNLSSGQPFEKDLQTFMRVAAKYNKTTTGVAFAFDYLQEVENDLKQKNPSPLAVFWSRRIFHAGILDTPELPSPAKWQQAIAILKAIDRILDNQRALGHRSLTVFAGPYPDNDWSRALARHFSKLRFHPDLLIVLGHYQFGDNTVKNCAVMPPTRHPDDDPPDNVAKAYSYDLSNGPFSLREFYASNGVSRGLLSVTMKGRWTEPKTSDAMDFFSPCLYDPSSESFGSYTEVCKHTRYAAELNYSASHYAMLAHQATGGRAFAYDNERGLCDKICRVKREVDDVYFGIAAYDIDYDDYGNYCASLNMYGPHSRLKALRKIVDYFRGLVGGQFDERACTSVVT